MSNFRHHHPKSFGGRGTELSNSWITEEELVTMRRQNSQYHSVMQNIPPSMHSPLLNQGSLLSTPNKSFVNQSSCKMPNSNFTRSPSLDIFKSSHIVNESNYQNRFVGNRFPNNSYSHLNMQHKMNEGTAFKDFASSNMSPQPHKNDGFSESIPKPLFSNVRQSQERLSCMQNDQTQFHSKYDNSRVYPEKGFPFSSDKDFQSQNQAPVNDHTSVGSNFSYKSNYRTSSLFPAYTPKEMEDESAKALQHSGYNSNFIEKSNTFCDKTPLSSTFIGKSNSLCDKSPTPSATYSKTMEPYHGKAEPFQEKAEPFQEKAEPFQLRNASDRVVNELFPPHSTTSSFMYDKQSLKTMCNSQVSHDSFKALEEAVALTGSKYSYPPESRQTCFQSPSEIPIQRSQNLQMSNHPSTTSSKDYFMQSVPFSSQSDIQQNMKENFSTFNFESNINTTDIADLLPGLDAFLKEHLEKPEEIPKNDMSKSSNCAFSDDEWSKHSIPFIGDNQASSENMQNNKHSYCDQSIYMKEKCSDKFELKSERVTELQLRDVINQANNSGIVGENVSKCSSESEASKVRSALEEAIELLVTNDAIVGLNYIIEYKKNIVQEGRIPFHCKLCNSAITRPSIIDHILGSKHRMRYLKAKDESKYEYIVSLKVEKSVKDAKISEAAFEMEKIYGRGHVIVDAVGYQKDLSVDNSSKEMKERTADPVFTLDKIPIGFEALSPQHEEMHTEFSLESNLNHANQDTVLGKKESTTIPTSTEVKKNAPCSIPSNSAFTLPGLGGGDSPFYNDKSDSNSILPQTNCDNEIPNICNVSKESDIKVLKQYSDSTVSCPVKRSLSPEPTIHAKLQKTDMSEESEPSTDMLTDKKQPDVKTEDSTSEVKEFNLDILEKLSKSTISSEEEASVVLQVINMLMELLLRYKLQHLCLEKVEKLMKSLQTISPENIEDLSSLLKDCNIVESKNVETSTSVLKDTTDNLQPKSSIPLEDNSGRQVRQELSSHTESSNSNVGELELSVKNVSDNCASGPGLETLDSAAEVSKNVTDVSCMYQVSNSQASSSVGLKPPPFFSWSQTNEALTNQVSYATVQGSQNMVWTSPYQHTQAQYAQLPYYQSQNYSNTYNGTQTYQSQYSVLPQNSVPAKMAHPPPLPPLPPPPPPAPPAPPAPSNSPLPPLPSSEAYPSPSTPSVSVPSDASAHVPLYSKQPLLPSPN